MSGDGTAALPAICIISTRCRLMGLEGLDALAPDRSRPLSMAKLTSPAGGQRLSFWWSG
jgi:hypothetical protein